MTFAAPIFLVLGVVFALAIALLAGVARRHRGVMLRRFAAARLLSGLAASASRAKRALKTALLMAGAFLVCAALARPQLGETWEEAQARGIDLLFSVDTSKSMLASDVKPDRLTRAKLAIHDLVTRFPGDRVGLVAFAGDAFLQVPLTLDHDVFEAALMGLEPGIIPRGGTDLARAITVSREALANEPGNEKLLVMLTDGEDLAGEAVAAAKEAAADGVTIYPIGVGSAAGELVPDPEGQGAAAVVRGADGKPVISKLDEETLRAVASATGGRYEALGADGRGLERLYEGTLAEVPKRLLESRRTRVPIERFQWPLAAGLLCLFLEGLIGDRRRSQRARARGGARWVGAAATALLAGVVTLGGGGAARAAGPAEALEAFQQGRYDEAGAIWRRALGEAPHDPRLLYDAGAAAYKAGQWDEAVKALEGATVGGSALVGPRGAYNLGNAYFRKGEEVLAGGDKEATKATWKQAIGAYEQALRLAPGDADTEHNLEVVKRRLAALEEPPPKEQQQDKDEKKDQQGGQGQDKKDQQGAQGQDKKDQQGAQGQDKKDQQGAQGQDEKDQQGAQGQDEKDQQGAQGQDKKDQQGAQGQDKKDQQGAQGQDKKDQQGAQGQDKKDQQGAQALQQPGSAAGAPGGEPDADQVRPAPGQMNRAEARALLDAHERGRPIPALPVAPGAQNPDTHPVTQDW